MNGLNWVCPKCGSKMRVNKGGAFCADEENCGFRVWRKVAGKELTDEELYAPTQGRKVLALGLKSKAGKSFSAWLVPGDKGRRSQGGAFQNREEEGQDPGLVR